MQAITWCRDFWWPQESKWKNEEIVSKVILRYQDPKMSQAYWGKVSIKTSAADVKSSAAALAVLSNFSTRNHQLTDKPAIVDKVNETGNLCN